MRNVPPESQIIPSVCEPPTVTSALNVVAGKSVVISRVASQSIAPKSRSGGGTLRRSPVTGYWTVVQHRAVQLGQTLRRPHVQILLREHRTAVSVAGKSPLILLLNSQRGEAGYASKKIVVRL